MSENPNFKLFLDRLSGRAMFLLTLSGASLLLIITLALFIKSLPALQEQPFFELLFSSAWKPMKGKFGFMPFISGTVWVTAVSLIVRVLFPYLPLFTFLNTQAGR